MNGITGAMAAPRPPEALPKETYIGGTKTVEVGGRTALLTHITNAHTDGDTWVYFADANVLSTGDTSNNTKRYQTIDFANGGDIRGMIAAQDAYLAASNDATKIRRRPRPAREEVGCRRIPRHAGDRARPHRETVQRGQERSRGGGCAAIADLDAKWAATEAAAVAFTRMVYNSFKRS